MKESRFVELTDAQLAACEVGVTNPRGMHDFTWRRPDHAEVDNAFEFYALSETEASRTYAAFGVKVTKTEVVVAIAVVDPFAHLSPEDSDAFLEAARSVVIDQAGTARPGMCPYGAHCSRRSTCWNSHGDVAADWWIRVLVRMVPDKLRIALAMSETKPTAAIVLQTSFPRVGDSDVDWSRQGPYAVGPMAVLCKHKFADDAVDRRLSDSGENAAFCDGTPSSTLRLLTRFCERVAFPAHSAASTRFDTMVLGGETGLDIDNVPVFEARKNPRLCGSVGRFLGRRRFLIDTCLDLFNHEATRYVADKDPSTFLVAKCWNVPEKTLRALDSTAVRAGLTHYKMAPNAPIPMGVVVKELDYTYSRMDASNLANDYLHGGFVCVAKFNAAHREWGCAINMYVLHTMVTPGEHAAFEVSYADVYQANGVLAQHLRREHELVKLFESVHESEMTIRSPTYDGTAIIELRPKRVNVKTARDTRPDEQEAG